MGVPTLSGEGLVCALSFLLSFHVCPPIHLASIIYHLSVIYIHQCYLLSNPLSICSPVCVSILARSLKGLREIDWGLFLALDEMLLFFTHCFVFVVYT